MKSILAALVAITVIAAAASPSYAFDAKTFWETHQHQGG